MLVFLLLSYAFFLYYEASKSACVYYKWRNKMKNSAILLTFKNFYKARYIFVSLSLLTSSCVHQGHQMSDSQGLSLSSEHLLSKPKNSEVIMANTTEMKLTTQDMQLIEKAKQVAQKAYCPYSHFHVGAALETQKGNTFTGCNIENACYTLANCGERTAIFTAAASEGPEMKIKTIVALCMDDKGELQNGSSCGACRQVIQQFATANTRVIYRLDNQWKVRKMQEVLPEPFRF